MRPDDAVFPVSIRLFGPFEVRLNGQPLPRLTFRRSRSILALLALRQGGEVERDWLAGLLWPDSAPSAAPHSLRNCLTDLRRALGPEAGRLRSPTARTLSLNLTGAFVDVLTFDVALARGDPEALEAAVSLYRGPLLEGSVEEWAFQERQGREQGYLTALETLAALALARADAAAAERYLRQAVGADPLRESAQRALMAALAAGGNYAAALLAYRELRLRLHRELNADPDPETKALFQRLREEARRLQERPPARARVESGKLRVESPAEPSPSLHSTLSAQLSTRSGENRLATVLLAGVGRSVEARHDLHPEETAALVNRLLGLMVDAVLKFGGQVDRFLGDGVLAVFGTPHAHEDDAERAIRAALEIREATRGLGMGVAAGINTGEVYLAGEGSDASGLPAGHPEARRGRPGAERHQEVTVAGAAVNLASRLQREAEPGQILVGEGAYRQTQRAFEFSPVSLAIKGLDQPVVAYAVGQALTRPEKARGIEGLRAELIGREEELAKLKVVLSELVQGRGQLVSLIGEAGVGKSRLVAEVKQWAVGCQPSAISEDRPGITDSRQPTADSPSADSRQPTADGLPLWLEGRCLELSMATGYSVFIDLFRDYFGWRLEDDERVRGERLAAWLQESVTHGELAAERLEETGPLLGNLLSARSESDWDERLQKASPEQIQYQTYLAVRDFLLALSQRQPVLLVLEDLHWADSLSLSLISFLIESLARAPIGVLCVYRPDREHKCAHLATLAERKCPERFTELRLRELTPEQSGQLVAALLPVENWPGGVKKRILEESGGNPFFLEELVRSLIDSRVVYREAGSAEGAGPVPGRWRAREGVETISVPESVQSLILSRFDRLRPELKQVLQGAAVIGGVFRPRLLERVVESPELSVQRSDRWGSAGLSTLSSRLSTLSTALWELEDQGLVYEVRAVPEVEYSFKHALMQETIYQRILRRDRAALHQRVAGAMEALYHDGLLEHYEQLAYHYERSTDDEKAVQYLLKAGEKAKRAYLNEDAIGYFERALERLDRLGSGARGQGSGKVSLRDDFDSVALSDPWPLTPDPWSKATWRLEALRALGEIYQGIGKHSEAEERFRQAIALGQEIGLAPRELARLYFGLGDTLIWQRRADEMIDPAEQVLALLGEHSESAEAALMNDIAGMGYRWKGDREKALEYMRRNARFLQRLPYSEVLRSPYSSVLIMYSHEEDNVEEAAQWAQVLEEMARQHHDLRALAGVLEFKSGLLQNRGDLRGAISPLQQALEPYGKIGGVQHQYLCFMRLRESYLSLGNLAEAEAYANKQREAAEAMENQREVAVSLLGIGKVFLCQGRWDQAADAFQRATQVNHGESWMRARVTFESGRAALARGKRREALEQLQKAAALEDAPDALHLVNLLSGLEEAFDDPEAFLAFCRRFRAERPEASDSPFVQWHLEPAVPDFGFRILDFGLPASEHEINSLDAYRTTGIRNSSAERASEIQNPKSKILNDGWVWHDPFGDCSLTVRDGLEIRAANGRDLWYPNRSAPRLLRPISGDFAIQAVCRSVTETAPSMGGLLLWRNKEQYLRLDWGTRGPHQVTFGGCLPEKQDAIQVRWGQKDVILGRGRLLGERIFLRLERRGGSVRALCSANGQRWFTVGQVEFPAEGELEVGLHAIGTIHRMIYPGAYPEGTGIRFESFELWTRRGDPGNAPQLSGNLAAGQRPAVG